MKRTLIRTIAILAPAMLIAAAPVRAEEASSEAASIDQTRSTLAKWMETQQIISKETREWEQGKDVLLQREALLRKEISELEAKIQQARSGIQETDSKHREMSNEEQALEQASAKLTTGIGELEAKTRRLLAALPDPLRERVAPLSRRIPEDPSRTDASLGERFQNVIGILNEVTKFNSDVAVTSELRPLPDGTTAEVQVLYIGLGQAYYVTPKHDAAGIGRPSPDGWVWTEANDLAPRIAQAIAMLHNEQPPAYVPLPVKIQ